MAKIGETDLWKNCGKAGKRQYWQGFKTKVKMWTTQSIAKKKFEVRQRTKQVEHACETAIRKPCWKAKIKVNKPVKALPEKGKKEEQKKDHLNQQNTIVRG